jgi:hypothetical protein
MFGLPCGNFQRNEEAAATRAIPKPKKAGATFTDQASAIRGLMLVQLQPARDEMHLD